MSMLKLRGRSRRNSGWPDCPPFSLCPGLRRAPQEDHPRIPRAHLPEIPRCSSGSWWWTAASTCRGAASPSPTHPGRVCNSEAEVANMMMLFVPLKQPHVALLFICTGQVSHSHITLSIILIDYSHIILSFFCVSSIWHYLNIHNLKLSCTFFRLNDLKVLLNIRVVWAGRSVAEGGDRSCLTAEGHSTQLQLLMCFWSIFVQAAAFHTTKMVALKLILWDSSRPQDVLLCFG